MSLREYRKQKGVKAKDVADLLRVTPTTYSIWEHRTGINNEREQEIHKIIDTIHAFEMAKKRMILIMKKRKPIMEMAKELESLRDVLEAYDSYIGETIAPPGLDEPERKERKKARLRRELAEVEPSLKETGPAK